LDLNEAKDYGVWGMQQHQLDHMQTSCSKQITTPTPHHSIFTGQMLFLMPNQQCQSTEGKKFIINTQQQVDAVIKILLQSGCWKSIDNDNVYLV